MLATQKLADFLRYLSLRGQMLSVYDNVQLLYARNRLPDAIFAHASVTHAISSEITTKRSNNSAEMTVPCRFHRLKLLSSEC